MRLAIADPPYPPHVTVRHDLAGCAPRVVTRSRAQRHYGARGTADVHPAASEWDEPTRHRQLLEHMVRDFDGWAIATTPDGIAAYGTLPLGTCLMSWVKPNAAPGGHRLRSAWEAVILFPPVGRRSGRGVVPDVLVEPHPCRGFTGSKPAAWTHWVLDALGYDPTTDTVADLFPGSGAVSAAVTSWAEPLT